ncbi:cellulose binding domain-containing protein [Dactylosporangium sp. NPDC051541]|uniref:cellulose binding domain-containing protein n=1 Tax=Dactylosporangium sp. NPDC051541 TaxID=3363977 RepID=UPI00379A545D
MRRALLVLATATALVVTAAGVAAAVTTAAADPDRIGGEVPGLTGAAAQAAAGAAGVHFRELAEQRQQRVAAAAQAQPLAAVLHEAWGTMFQQPNNQGIRATHSVFTGSAAVTHGQDVVYSPTVMSPGGACMEMTTAYTSSGPVLWAWDWCGGNPGVGKLVNIDANFLATYTTSVNGYAAYRTDVHKTNASNNQWTGYLYNYKTSAWDTFYVDSGAYDLDSPGFGWDIFEIYSERNPATNQAWYCGSMSGRKFEASSIEINLNGTWQAATSGNSFPSSTSANGSLLDCPALTFTMVTANSHWIGQIGPAPTLSPSATRSASASPTPSRTSSPTPTQTTASGACTATYKTTNSWGGGFQGEVTVKAGASVISSWTTRWTLASGQAVNQVWNGRLTTSGITATVTNETYNGGLAAGASTTFGFLATGTPTTPTVTCTSP